jgi:CRP/FNR family nitrogen fixation transcriptional regulator
MDSTTTARGIIRLLVRLNTANRRPIDGHLAALVRERIFSSEFKYRKGMEVFGEGEETKYVYQIIDGAVRTYKLLPDGRRQINSFHLPGDMFGLENGPTHRFTAEAVVETNVRTTRPCSLLDSLAKPQGGRNKSSPSCHANSSAH